MEYIKGRPLARLWLSMTLWQRFIVAWTLRSYIRQLRTASAAHERRTVPGPMSDSPQAFGTPVWMFGDRFKGPYNIWTEFCDELNSIYGKRGLGLFNPTEDLILTHCNLSTRNIVVGEDGRLWLVDWGMSGFFPPWFEYIATMSAAFRDAAPENWFKYIPLITGYYPAEQKILGWGNPRDIIERGRIYVFKTPVF
ncbi:hypothetical protein OE88DRAFT_1731036 [Heliocybe sulcata]|uniref:Aminoglycoside phosphotransferase domain-containing protein n=1 Tax=Heliocybe sulcata TaxID=5364 RepID=A0A5C3NJY1_9AGAM|nr:hypothetical protein OE88DRAFT_1731036 [Heliocybe sulcata]